MSFPRSAFSGRLARFGLSLGLAAALLVGQLGQGDGLARAASLPPEAPAPILAAENVGAANSADAISRPASTTITVNTFADDLAANGNCTLREAIQAANTDSTVDACPAGSGADTIVLAAGTYTLTIAGASEDANATGDFDITNALTIIGAGPAATVINANGLDRAFHAIGSAKIGRASCRERV